MRYQTRDFGEIEIENGQILRFAQPIFGFDDYQEYAVLHDPDVGMELAWLQSLDEPDLCFVLISPKAVEAVYQPRFPESLRNLIGEGEYEYWLIAVIQDDYAKSTVNLKSPVVINWKTGCGAQVILEGDYPLRRPLMEEAQGTC
jgi:flagellar assembly factor FliW